MRHPLKYLVGWWRGRFGVCPLCNSSPPVPSCPVCLGTYQYGHEATEITRKLWWERFKKNLQSPVHPVCDFIRMGICAAPYYASDDFDVICCNFHKAQYERANPEIDPHWRMIWVNLRLQ